MPIAPGFTFRVTTLETKTYIISEVPRPSKISWPKRGLPVVVGLGGQRFAATGQDAEAWRGCTSSPRPGTSSILRYAVGRALRIVTLWFWTVSKSPSGVNLGIRDAAAPNRKGIVATVEYPPASEMGAGPQMMSFGWTFHPYLPKVSGTIRASSR